MPATSVAFRQAAAIAEHHPEKLYKRNRGLARLGKRTLHDFASTPEKGLPYRKGKSLKDMATVGM